MQLREGYTQEVSDTEADTMRDDGSLDLDGRGRVVRSGQIHFVVIKVYHLK